MSIKDQFDKISKDYDEQRRQLLPCFEDYYHLPLAMLDNETEAPKILDIGGGTGLFSSIVLPKYPKAQFMLIDLWKKCFLWPKYASLVWITLRTLCRIIQNIGTR